ncbi:PA3496 family putative envelope integrity protein [Pseudomonas sp. NW5]|uniref:PA3496 family putative envelope integrity protein n=1 Tax=Pseudomonas sp. NW5 TaxID=2934934 RepID=UPI002020CF56|nr:transcriptional regulator [Pseudomonas sp. NW5]MCL7463292.1 transcriptional regulator [Pseudomonas sp. NW5]
MTSRLFSDTPFSHVKQRRKQADQRRMAFRRAIEQYQDGQRLLVELESYSDGLPADYRHQLHREARQVHLRVVG